jgi:hypothetical protein
MENPDSGGEADWTSLLTTPHAAALFRNTSSRKRSGFTNHPGAAWPQFFGFYAGMSEALELSD